MRAAIYNPYLDTLGGGERYTMTFAKVLSDSGYKVDVEWKDPEIKKKLELRFGLDLTNINFTSDVKKGEDYDLCFWVSDGSIPLLHARRNFLHFQVPFHNTGGNSLINKMKFIRIDKVICNSLFTKKVIDKEFGIESIVIYPPVDTEKIKPKRKENIILSVSRFSGLLQNKSQGILVEAFKKFYDGGMKKWKLILTGGVEVGTGDYIEKLKDLSGGYPVEIIKSPDYKQIKELYGKAKIFWSASGFGEDEREHPEKVEHFGITVVEAMSAGAVPLAYNAGGYKEIITDGEDGFLWHNTEELIALTGEAIEKRTILSGHSRARSKIYSNEEFRKNIIKIL